MKKLLLAAAALCLAACGASPQTVLPQGDPAVPLVSVARRDITEVVALPSTVVATPKFLVLAPATGRVRREGDLFSVSGKAASLSVPATLVEWLVDDGAMVAAGVPVAEASYSGFGEVAVLPPQDAYRLLSGELKARGSIAGGHGPFDCPVLVSTPADGRATVVCAIPLEVTAFAGLTGTVAISSRQARQVLALPVTAVSGTAQAGEVAVKGADGQVTVQKVTLGVTDGSYVEITGGLAEGTTVLATAPPLEGLP